MALDRDEALMLSGILSRARNEMRTVEDALVDATEGDVRIVDLMRYVAARNLLNEFEERLPLEAED